MRIMGLLSRHATLHPTQPLVSSIRDGTLRQLGSKRCFSTQSEDPELKDFMEYLDSLKNYEKLAVPRGSGTDSEDGFNLGRMRQFMEQLGNPQSKFKVVHIAGTKGKGSTAAFLFNIADGYSVGCYSRCGLLVILVIFLMFLRNESRDLGGL